MTRFLMAGAAALVLAAVTPAFAESDDGSSSGKGGASSGDDSSGGNGSSGKGAYRVNAASATGTGSVVVFTPVTVTQTQGLDFGAITSGAAGDVTIDPASGGRNVDGGVGAVAADVGQAGAFAVTGQANAAINVVVGQAITGFTAGITGVTKVRALPTVLTGASATFNVGGSLAIPAKTKAGAYTGTYTVAVNYP